MNIDYLKHSCFRIETQPAGHGKEKVTALIDPYEDSLGLKLPKTNADLVLTTHPHYDHANLKPFPNAFAIDSPGEYTFKGVSVKGIQTFHDDQEGAERGLNTVYVLESEGVKVCHLGDLGHVLTEEQVEALGDIHLLLIPVGGTYTIGPKEAAEVTKKIEPALVAPMHYNDPKVKVSGLAPVADFYKELGIQPEEKVKRLKLKEGMFKGEETLQVIEFN